MNTEHTPGPWRVGDGSFVISDHPTPGITGSDDVHIYGGHLICESVSQPNARLIAAAPELLEALKALLRECKYQAEIGNMPNDRVEFAVAAAAIAKAEGKA